MHIQGKTPVKGQCLSLLLYVLQNLAEKETGSFPASFFCQFIFGIIWITVPDE